MLRLRNRLVLVFLIGSIAPLLFSILIARLLLDRSLSMAPVSELSNATASLESTGRELYQRARRQLRQTAADTRTPSQRYAAGDRAKWPERISDFAGSSDTERFLLAGESGNRLDYLVRHGKDVWLYSAALGVPLQQISAQIAQSRAALQRSSVRDLRRGFFYTLLSITAAVWILCVVALVYLANRISSPIAQLTKGLAAVAGGSLEHRLPEDRYDEVGRAMCAFNDMAGQLQRSQEHLVHVTRLSSWQTLARKMAHEIKNSLTPIRLTMEEIGARRANDPLLSQASQIVVDEVTGLERRVRAFSQFASEPPVYPTSVDVNALLAERISFLKSSHPDVAYDLRLSGERPLALADEDLIRGVLTNLLENAAEAAPGGLVLGVTNASGGKVAIEVHDSGPGLSPQARETLFEPAISFKRGGMGLGLSIAHRSAVRLGGDICLVTSELGGAGFRVLLPPAS